MSLRNSRAWAAVNRFDISLVIMRSKNGASMGISIVYVFELLQLGDAEVYLTRAIMD